MTTPGGLRAALIALTVGIVACGAIVTISVLHRREAAVKVGDEAAPLLIRAQDLYLSLADADATASTIFLEAGVEDRTRRASYDEDLRRAGEQLAAISANADLSPAARDALGTISEELPRYAELVGTARTNNRLDFPVGAAYLRDASDVMELTILPAASTVFRESVQQLDEGYVDGTSRQPVVAMIVAVAVVVVVLIVVQLFMIGRTRRLLNLGLVAATVLLVALAIMATVMLDDQRRSLEASQRQGEEPLTTLSVTRILALQSLSYENLYLIDREQDHYLVDFDTVTTSIADLLARAAGDAPDEATRVRIESIADLHGTYLGVHDRVRGLDAAYDYDGAENLAVAEQAPAARAVDDALAVEIAAAAGALDGGAARAASSARWLPALVIVFALLAFACAVVGLELRLREFR